MSQHTLAQVREIYVYGTVVDEQQNPVEGACVVLLYPPDSVETNVDGSFIKLFTFEGMVGEKLKFDVKMEGYKHYYGSTIVESDTLNLGKIVLEKIGDTRTITVYGFVLDSATNTPIEDALIIMYPKNFINLPPDSCYSSNFGAFIGNLVIEASDKSPIFIYSCEKDGYISNGRIVTADSTDFFQVDTIYLKTVELLTFHLPGNTEDSLTGDPVANAQVILMKSTPSMFKQDTLVSDAQGEFLDSIIIANNQVSMGCKIFCFVMKDGYRDALKRVYIPPENFEIGTIKMSPLTDPATISISGAVRDSVSLNPLENVSIILGNTIECDGNKPLLVIRDTLFTDNEGTITDVFIFDTASYPNTEIVFRIQVENYVTKEGFIKLSDVSLNLGEVLLVPLSTPVFPNGIRYTSSLQKPNTVHIYTLNGKNIYNGKCVDKAVLIKTLQTLSQKVFIVVYKRNDVVLYSEKVLKIPRDNL